MSILKTIYLQHLNGAAPNATLDANGNMTVTGTIVAGSSMGMRNRIINGAMMIDQRNNGSAVTYDGSTSYSIDRYYSSEIGDGAFTVQRVSDGPAGFINSLKVTVTTAQTGTLNAGTMQFIEGYNVADLAWGTSSARPVTLSFWVKCSVTGNLGGAIQNSSNARSYPFRYTVNAANTWEYKTITIPGDTSGTWATDYTTGINIRFGHGASATTGTLNTWASADYRSPTGSTWIIQTVGATWQITGLQLEVGSVATPFEFRHYGQELALCQRYYFQLTASGASQGMLAQGHLYATTQWEGIITFPVDMRTIPVATFTAASTFTLRPSGVVPSSIGYYSATGPGTRQMLIYTGHSAFGSAGLAQSLAQTTPGLTGIYFNAEL
jgi:hypothetical protein